VKQMSFKSAVKGRGVIDGESEGDDERRVHVYSCVMRSCKLHRRETRSAGKGNRLPYSLRSCD